MISGWSGYWQQIDRSCEYHEATHHYSIDVWGDWCGSDHKYLCDNHIYPVISAGLFDISQEG